MDGPYSVKQDNGTILAKTQILGKYPVGETPPPSLCSEEAKGCDFTG